MPGFCCRYALLLGGYLAGHGCLAQRAPIAPLQPSQPAVVVPAPGIILKSPAGTMARQPMQPVAAPAATPARTLTPGPLLLLDTRLIVGGNALAAINPQDIKSLRVYKEPAGTPAPWGELLRYGGLSGIFDITLKKPLRLPSQRLAQLGHRLRVKQAAYLLNGTAVTDTRLRIATAAIKEITVTYSPAGAVINVQLFTLSDVPATPHPPGTIIIRGMAAR